MTSGPRTKNSPSAATLVSRPGSGFPTEPNTASRGWFAVAIPLSSDMPQTSVIGRPRPMKKANVSLGIGASPEINHLARSRQIDADFAEYQFVGERVLDAVGN